MTSINLSLDVAKALIESAARTQAEPYGKEKAPSVTVTISREVGAQGTPVAREVGRLLAWPVYDQEVIDLVAEKLKRPSFLLRRLDERPATWLDRVIGDIANDYKISPSAYLTYLISVVRGLGKIGHCVIVGRGASHILPPESTLRVRLVAAPADRARVVHERTGLDIKEAARWAEQAEHARVEFVRHNFGVDTADPHRYDLVLNTSRLSVVSCARIVVDIVRESHHDQSQGAEAESIATAESL